METKAWKLAIVFERHSGNSQVEPCHILSRIKISDMPSLLLYLLHRNCGSSFDNEFIMLVLDPDLVLTLFRVKKLSS